MHDGTRADDALGRTPSVELEALVAALRESDRRRDQFLATLAHELRNPLAAVHYAIHVLEARMPPLPELQSTVEVIARQIQQMTHLIGDITDVSRIVRGSIELQLCRVTAGEVIRCAVEETRPLIEAAGHELTVALPGEPIFLDADPVRLAQVFSNLLSNAAKYTPRGGRIAVQVERQSEDVVVCVRDNGLGIPAPMLKRIFEPFIQLDDSLERARDGLGIGLALARELLRLHGGTIDAISDGPGQGSEFRVRLGLSKIEDALENAVVQPRALTLARVPGTRILIADDDADSVATLTVVLRDSGYQVCTAEDGRRALEAAQHFRPAAALLDIAMPACNGYDLVRWIRSQPWGRTILLIAVTGWGDAKHRQRAIEAGFDHYLVKPVELEALSRLLDSLAR